MSSKPEAQPSQNPQAQTIDPVWKEKLDKLKALQKELEEAFAEAKKYEGQTEQDQKIYAKIERILNDMAALTAVDPTKK